MAAATGLLLPGIAAFATAFFFAGAASGAVAVLVLAAGFAVFVAIAVFAVVADAGFANAVEVGETDAGFF